MRREQRLPVVLATTKSFAPFGWLINLQADQAHATEVLEADGVFAYYPQAQSRTINPGNERFVGSPLRVDSRPRLVTDKMEFHNCHEVLTFFDRAILVVGPQAPASGKFEDVSPNGWAAFAVDRHCSVVMEPRTLHALAFPWNNRPVMVMVMLPFKAHQTNLYFVDFPADFSLRPVKPMFFPME